MSILRKDGYSIVNPDRRGWGEGTSVLFEFPRDSFSQHLGAGSLGLGKKDRELVPAGPTRNVRPANGFQTRAGHASQNFVSRGVPIGVIDGLEFAKIKREQRERRSIASGTVDLLIQILLK